EANCDPYSQCVLSDAGIVGDAHSDCIGTGGANPESSEIHSTGPSWMPDACASTSALRRASGPRRLERIAACNLPRPQPGHEPARALFRRAMGESVGY